MININSLPDAWRLIDKLYGEQGNEKDELYQIYYKISTAIFDYRIKNRLTQKKLADKLGITQAMVSKLESGDYNYTVEQLWKISKKLGFKLNIELIDLTEEMDYLQHDCQSNIVYSVMAVG